MLQVAGIVATQANVSIEYALWEMPGVMFYAIASENGFAPYRYQPHEVFEYMRTSGIADKIRKRRKEHPPPPRPTKGR